MITPPEALPFLKVDKDEEKGTETKEWRRIIGNI
jgi:hypothetical protein